MLPASPLKGDGLRVVEIDLGDCRQRDRYIDFRTDFFGRHLGWNVTNGNGVDYGDIDEASTHFGLCGPGGAIVGCVRVTPPSHRRWAIDERPFSELVDRALDPGYPRLQCAEISRLGVYPEFVRASDASGFTASRMLHRAAYQHSMRLGLRFWYVVAYGSLIDALCRFDYLPFKAISPFGLNGSGGTRIACLDLELARASVRRRAPEFYDWNHIGLENLPGDGRTWGLSHPSDSRRF